MQSTPNIKRNARWPWISAFVTALAGVSLSVILWQGRIQAEHKGIEDEFFIEASTLQQRIEREARLFMKVLESIRYLHNISERISQEDFNEFVEKGMLYQQSVLGGFGFVQRIPNDLRKALEQNPSSGTTPSLRIVESDGAGGFRSADERPEYYPLTYQTPTNALGVPVGFDFASKETDQKAIDEMVTSSGPVIGSRLSPPGADEGRSEVFVYAPIYYTPTNETEQVLPVYFVGFAVALFKPKEIIDSVVPGLGGQNLRVRLIDPGLNVVPETPKLQHKPSLSVAYALEAPMHVANRTWIFRCEAGDEYVRRHETKQPEILLNAGLVITGLLSLQLLLMAGRGRRVEKLVRQRTAELQEANQRLEEAMTERLRLENEILEVASREQQRVGRDLHDSLGQKLTGAVYLSRALMSRLNQASTEDRADAEKINVILKESVAQVRRIAHGLAPIDLSHDSLVDALRRLADESREAYGVPCEVIVKGPAPVPGGTRAEHLYHIAQEAVNNAVRHGKAAEIVIHLALEESHSCLTITDDGVGMPEDLIRKDGMGLRIMQYRASIIGGPLEIWNRPEGGTEIKCCFKSEGKDSKQ
jgi:signal transduction histidine kinase